MLDIDVFIFSCAAGGIAAMALVGLLKLSLLRARPPEADIRRAAGLQAGECCVIPYNGGTMVGSYSVSNLNPVYCAPNDKAVGVILAELTRAESLSAAVWRVGRVDDMWWVAMANGQDEASVAVVARLLPPGLNIPIAWSLQEAQEYLGVLSCPVDRLEMGQ